MFENKKRDIAIIIIIFISIGLIGFGAPFAVEKIKNFQKRWSQRVVPTKLTQEEKARLIKENKEILDRIKKNDKNGESSFSGAYVKLATNEELLGQLWKAEEYYKKSLAEDSKNRVAYEHFAHFLTKLGRNTEASAQYRAAIESDPGIPSGYIDFASFASNWLNDSDMARGIYIEGLMRTKNDRGLMKDFALFLERTGEKYQAYLYWLEILKKEPGNKDALTHIAHLKPQIQDILKAPMTPKAPQGAQELRKK